MEIIDIGYVEKLPAIGDQVAGKLIMHKSVDTNCDEYRLFLPEMQKFIKKYEEKHEWIFAKSMPQCPHEYVCKKNLTNSADIDEFHNVVKFIQKYGYDNKWFSTTHRYLNVGTFKYWTMGWHWPQTIIINRAIIEDNI